MKLPVELYDTIDNPTELNVEYRNTCKLSDYIETLQGILSTYGDLPVYKFNDDYLTPVDDIRLYGQVKTIIWSPDGYKYGTNHVEIESLIHFEI